MSSYIKPQVLVFQEFSIVPTEITEPLRAHIAGPHAILHRYNDRDERPTILLGQYDRLSDICYPWPQRRAGSIVDLAYGKVFIDDAMLKYFQHDLQDTTSHITAVDGKINWIESDTLAFKSNTSAYPRSSAFGDRDVAAGDIAYLRTVVDRNGECEEVELWSEVVGFASEPVASLIKPAENDTLNVGYTAASVDTPDSNNDYLQTGGKINCVKLEETDGSTYEGLSSGDITEEYTIQVVKSTISGCNAARLRVRSASGRDDQEEVVPADMGEFTSIGTRGLKVKFNVLTTDACLSQSSVNGVAYDSFVVGQRWVVNVAQEFYPADADTADADGNPAVADVEGVYEGDKNDVYVIEVTKGGEFDGVSATAVGFPEVTVRTVKGLDFSGPTEVTNNGGVIGIGTNGVQAILSVGGAVKSLEIQDGGSNYDTAAVTLSAPDEAGGTQATATATVVDGAVDSITITNPGSGYYNPPTVTITAGSTGAGAAVQASLNVGLRKGDRFFVTVVSSKAGFVRRLILRDDLPSEMRDVYTRATDPSGASLVQNAVDLVAVANVDVAAGGSVDIDGVTPADGDRVLLTGQTDAVENGLYEVNAGGSWVRAGDADESAELVKNTFYPITAGTTYAGSGWVITNAGTVVVGDDPIYIVRDDEANTERPVPLDLKLYIKDEVQVSRVRPEAPALTNYWFEDTQVCIQEGITAYHPEWTAGGVEKPLPVESGRVYAEYREFVADLADEVNSISDVADLDNLVGQLDPDNPLKWGVYKALSNSNGTVVKYTAVAKPVEYDPDTYEETGPDLDSWVQVLERIKGRDDMYNLVPLTFNRQVQNLWAAHIDAESDEISNNWKGGFFSLKAQPNQLVVGQGATIGGVLGTEMPEAKLATLSDDPNATGSNQFTLLQVPTDTAGTSGYFITNGVQPGDIVRYNFSIDQFGDEQYEEYLVDQVLSENSLLLFTSADAAVTVAQRFEIWHTRNRNEVAEDLAQQAGGFSNRRIVGVWPDLVAEGGVSQDGYYLSSALAGLASGVVPHQPLTNVEVAGFDDFTRSYKYFNETQLNRMAEAGVWIVTEDRDGTPHNRHALTTDNLDLNRREEMIRRNVDSMSYLFLRRLRPFIGRTNVQPGMLRRLRYEVTAIIRYLSNNGYTEELGSQLISGEIRTLEVHPLLRDRIVIVLDLVVPAPLNNIELHLVV
jgi:hypothetical protein